MAHGRAYRQAVRQAKLAADIQTAPQFSALRLLLRQAQQQYAVGVRQARGGAGVLQAAAKAAEPKVASYFTGAGASIGRNLAASGVNTSNPLVNADIADTLNRLAATRASAQSEVRQRGVDAAAGATYQIENLGQQRRADVQKIGQQMLDLSGQKGKVQTSTLLTLLNQAAGRAVTRRGQNLSHSDRQAEIDLRRQSQHDARVKSNQDFLAKYGVTRARAQQLGNNLPRYLKANHLGPYAKGKGGSGSSSHPSLGPGSLTPFQESGLRDRIDQIVSVIKSAPQQDDNGKPLTDHALRQHLLNGTSPLKKPIPADLVNIAFDLAKKGYLSVPNMQAAHGRGLHIPRHWLAKRIPGVTPGVAGPPQPGL